MDAPTPNIDDFFDFVEHNPMQACKMIKKDHEYALLMRPFSSQTALEFALHCYQKKCALRTCCGCFVKIPKKDYDYTGLLEILIERNISYSKRNPLKAYGPHEIDAVIESDCNDTNIRAELKAMISLYASFGDRQQLQLSDDDFFKAFNNNHKKLIVFFDQCPQWFDKVHATGNTTLHLALKNFSGSDEDFVLMKKLIQYNPQNLSVKNKKDEDCFDVITTFQPYIKKELYSCLRSSLKGCFIGRNLKQAFVKAMQGKKYLAIATMLNKNPELINEIDPFQSKTIIHYINNPPTTLTQEEASAIKKIRSFVDLCAPDLKEIELPIVRTGRISERRENLVITGARSFLQNVEDLRKKPNDEESVETIWSRDNRVDNGDKEDKINKSDKKVPTTECI